MQTETAPPGSHDALTSISQAVFVISSAAPIQVNAASSSSRESGSFEGSYLNMPTADFDDPTRFIRMPSDRDDTEVTTSRWYAETEEEANGDLSPDPPPWLNRMVQWAPRARQDPDLGKILYAIFSRSVSILGARPADQLITVFLHEYDDVHLVQPQGKASLGEFHLQVFAVLKAVRPTQSGYFFIRFSPVVAMTAILRSKNPWNDHTSAEERTLLLDIYNALGTSRVKSGEKTYRGITDLLQDAFADYFFAGYHYLNDDQIEALKAENDPKAAYSTMLSSENSQIKTLKGAEFGVVTKWGVRTFMGAVFQCPLSVIRSLICPTVGAAPDRATNGSFYLLLQELLAPGNAFDGKSYRELIEAQLDNKSIREFTKECLPQNAYLLLSPHSIGLFAPGRRLQMVYEDEGNPLGSDREKRFRDACAWNILVLSLTAMQEALLALYHRRLGDEEISEDGLKDVAQSAIEDLSDYFDVSFFKSYASAFFRDAYEQMQRVNGIDHQYRMLRERLSLALGKNSFAMASTLGSSAKNTLDTAEATQKMAQATQSTVIGINSTVAELKRSLRVAVFAIFISIAALLISAGPMYFAMKDDGIIRDVDTVTTTIEHDIAALPQRLLLRAETASKKNK